jgi:mRNA interferase MazF
VVAYIPDRGDIVWLNFDPQAGKEIKKKRPALIVSPKIYQQKVGLALCMPITSKVKGYPFEVVIQNKRISGAVLSDQMRSMDWRQRKATFIIKIESHCFAEVIQKFLTLVE